MTFASDALEAISSLLNPALRMPMAEIARYRQNRDAFLREEELIDNELAELDRQRVAASDELSDILAELEQDEDRRNEAVIEEHRGMFTPLSYDRC
jgi:hypothetical protein